MTLVTRFATLSLLTLGLPACGGRTAMEAPYLESVSPTWARNNAPAVIEIASKDIGAADIPSVFIGWNALASVHCGSPDAVGGIVPAGLEPGIWRLHVVLGDGTLAEGALDFAVYPADRAP